MFSQYLSIRDTVNLLSHIAELNSLQYNILLFFFAQATRLLESQSINSSSRCAYALNVVLVLLAGHLGHIVLSRLVLLDALNDVVGADLDQGAN